MIRVYRMAPDVRTLGPGSRFCLWVQGCSRHCPGCMSPETWDPQGGTLWREEDLARKIGRFAFEGITISGGEPFLQPGPLATLLGLLRAGRDMGVMVYTGFTLEELRARQDPDTDAFLEQIDLLVDGPYQEALDDDGALRGSSNQRAICLSDRYAAGLGDWFGKAGQRRQQVQIDEMGVLRIGLRRHEGGTGMG